MLYSIRKEKTGINRGDPILPFYPTQHLSLMQFNVRYFYQQMIKILNSVQSLPYLIGYC